MLQLKQSVSFKGAAPGRSTVAQWEAQTQQCICGSSQSQWVGSFLSNEQTKLGGRWLMVDLEGVRGAVCGVNRSKYILGNPQ